MFDQLTEIFCDFDDFCKEVVPNWEATLLECDKSAKKPTKQEQYGPSCGLCRSEIMTILVMYHGSRFKNFKTFYNGIVLRLGRCYFPKAPCYERFLTLTKRAWLLLTFFMAYRFGSKTGVYYIDSTPLAVCHNKRINKHKVFRDLAARGKTSMGWFFGFKIHFVFNSLREIVAVQMTPGNISDASVVPKLTQDLTGKLFGDKGYIGKKLTQSLLERGLVLMTRVRKNMKSLPMTIDDKRLLNKRNIAETIIGHIKEFSSLRMPKHRSVINAFTHVVASIIAYPINPLSPYAES